LNLLPVRLCKTAYNIGSVTGSIVGGFVGEVSGGTITNGY
jgi:hypothetical protein